MKRAMLLFVLATCASCASETAETELCAITAAPGLAPELFFATRIPGDHATVLAGAFDGAAPPGETLIIRDRDGVELSRAVVSPSGRITSSVAPSGEEITVEREGQNAKLTLCVRDPDAARAGAVRPAIEGAGSVPNDLVIAGSRGVLVRSGDNAVNVFDLERGLDAGHLGVRLPELEDRCGTHRASPWFAAPLDAGGARVAVTAFGQRHVYVVDLDRGEIETALEVNRPVQLAEPVTLPMEVDLECDGAASSEVASFVPSTPQAIALAGDHLVASFTSFVRSRPAIFLPGTIAVWSASDLSRAPQVHLLPAYNPQELRALDDHRVLVVCSGVIDPVGERVTVLSPGAVMIFDLARGEIEKTFELGDFAPGTAIARGDSLWVGSVARAVVRRIDLASGAVLGEVELTTEPIDSVLRLVELPGGLIGAPSFDTDRLFVIDASNARLSPAPFFEPLQLGPGRPIPDGLQIVARRPGRAGIDFQGPDLFALAGPASRVTPIELRRLLGP